MLRPRVLLLTVVFCAAGLMARAQQAPVVDTSTIGPQIGTRVPPFTGVDQFGRSQSLESALGPKGAMLVFFRSADW